MTHTFMNMWSEDTTGRGSYEIVSCLNKYLNTKNIPSDHGQTTVVVITKTKML